jgi:hypothetical protein
MKQWSALFLTFLAYPLIGMQLPAVAELTADDIDGLLPSGILTFPEVNEKVDLAHPHPFSGKSYALSIQEQLQRSGGMIFARIVNQRGNNPTDSYVQYLDWKTYQMIRPPLPAVAVGVPFNGPAPANPIAPDILADARWVPRKNAIPLDNRPLGQVEATSFFLLAHGGKIRYLGDFNELNIGGQSDATFQTYLDAYYGADPRKQIQAQLTLANSFKQAEEFIPAQKLFARLAAQNQSSHATIVSKFSLAQMQYEGAMPGDFKTMEKLFTATANQESEPSYRYAATFALARLYHMGYGNEGTGKDGKKAYSLYFQAARQSFNKEAQQGAQLGLGCICFGKQEVAEASNWLSLAMGGSDNDKKSLAKNMLDVLQEERSDSSEDGMQLT